MSHLLDETVKFVRDRTTDVSLPKLKKGICTGVVVGNLQPNQLILVKPDGNYEAINCIWAASILSGLLGFKTTYVPPIKTRVVIYYTEAQVSYIIGSYSNTLSSIGLERGVTDHDGHPTEDLNTFSSQRDDKSRMATEHAPPIDMVEGEINIDNLMGVGLTLLRHMSSLQAGDLARVECHLLDDMVRVISRTFKHHSAFGDFKIVNDGGKLNVEWNGTSLDHEAWGHIKPGTPKVGLDQKGDNVEMGEALGYTDDGRWRFTQYIGWLGDFINLFVTDPVNAVGEIAANHFRSGKARMHVNNDGAVLVQSIADIVLEKVVRIPVPVRKHLAEDPQGNRSDDSIRNPNQLDQWDPSDFRNPFEMAFQLREYARWLNNTHSLARFRQMSRDFQVPSEQQTPAPQLNSDEQDKEQINVGVDNTRLGYSCIRIYRDGSIQTVDAYGNSMLSTAIGVQISSTTDILIQAAGSVNIVAGRDFNVLAHGDVGVNAVGLLSKIRLAASTGIHQYISKIGNFIMECATVGGVFLKRASLTVNDVMSVSIAGAVNTYNTITGVEISASVTMPADDHMGHIFPGVPVVIPGVEEFIFPPIYDGLFPGNPDSPLYQTHAQSTLDITRLEQPTNIVDRVKYVPWAFDAENPTTKGSPWPGSPGILEKKILPVAGQDLNHPSGSIASAEPLPMVPTPIIIMRRQIP